MKLLATLDLDAAVSRLAFSPDGTQLVAGLDDGTVVMIPVGQPTRKPKVVFELDSPVRALTVTPDGKRIAVAGEDITIVTVSRRKPYRVLKGHNAPVEHLCVTTDGKKLVSAALDGDGGSVRLWTVASGMEWPPGDGLSAPVAGMALFGDDEWLAIVKKGSTKVDLHQIFWDGAFLYTKSVDVGFEVGPVCWSSELAVGAVNRAAIAFLDTDQRRVANVVESPSSEHQTVAGLRYRRFNQFPLGKRDQRGLVALMVGPADHGTLVHWPNITDGAQTLDLGPGQNVLAVSANGRAQMDPTSAACDIAVGGTDGRLSLVQALD